jgi:predicted metal-dependent enzyme (double-stranded beta helix superfamily)
MDPRLESFVAACDSRFGDGRAAGACISEAAPKMLDLAKAGPGLLSADERRDNPEHYARNALHLGSDAGVSLFALVWRPGQWTPVHDHGTWGVVGVLEGVLEERGFMPRGVLSDDEGEAKLDPGGTVMLAAGSVTTFVPNPDHIHMTGVPMDGEPVVSLHLYGRAMNSYHFYDLEMGTRHLIDVPHFRS